MEDWRGEDAAVLTAGDDGAARLELVLLFEGAVATGARDEVLSLPEVEDSDAVELGRLLEIFGEDAAVLGVDTREVVDLSELLGALVDGREALPLSEPEFLALPLFSELSVLAMPVSYGVTVTVPIAPVALSDPIHISPSRTTVSTPALENTMPGTRP